MISDYEFFNVLVSIFELLKVFLGTWLIKQIVAILWFCYKEYLT